MAESENFVGRGTETRTFLYFKVLRDALRTYVPEGWQVRPLADGPASGANLMAAFVDQTTSLDAEGKSLEPMRYVLFEIPIGDAATGSTAWSLFTGLSTGGVGVYGTNLQASAEVERTVRHAASGSAVGESWDLKTGAGESVSLQLRFHRGPLSVQQAESRVYSQARPGFFRIYRVEQAVDVVQSTTDASRLSEVAFQQQTAKLAPLFDGMEQLIAIVSVPVYARRVFLPCD